MFVTNVLSNPFGTQTPPAEVIPSTFSTTTSTEHRSIQAPTLEPVPSNLNLKTYTNSQYKFSLQYPKTVTVNPNCSERVHTDECNSLIVFYEKNQKSGSSFIDGSIIVDATTSPEYVLNCMSEVADGSSKTTLNGIPFIYHPGPPDMGMGKFGIDDLYSTLHGNVCYSLTVIESNYSGGPYVTSSAKVDLESILQSFKFIDTASAISVPGMSQYTDKDFGFSFWYPSGWTVSNVLSIYSDPTNDLWVSKDGSNRRIDITVVDAPFIVDEAHNGYENKIKYFFDASTHTWMTSMINYYDPSSNSTTTADVSHNTMGGLHMLKGLDEPFADTIVPLTAHHFLLIAATRGWQDRASPYQNFLANTIVATDPSVATPVSQAQQTATIQDEKNAYAGQ